MKYECVFFGKRFLVFAIVSLSVSIVHPHAVGMSEVALAGENRSESGIKNSTCLGNYDGDDAVTSKDLYFFSGDFGLPNYDPNGPLESDLDNDGDMD